MWRLRRAAKFSVLRCLDYFKLQLSNFRLKRSRSMNFNVTRRMFAVRFASVLSALGLSAAASPVLAKAQSAAAQDSGIRKLNSEGKPGSDKDVIMPVIVHNGLIYVAGQGAHDSRDSKEWTIESHTTMVMDKIKKHVEIGGGSMDTILQANVFLVKIEHWDGMHKVFATYFPHGGSSAEKSTPIPLRDDSHQSAPWCFTYELRRQYN